MTDDPPNSRPDSGGEPLRAPATITGLRDAAAHCTACGLYRNATQTVFGEGLEGALVMLIGEQPGDAEDLAGHPFVGPAGKLLDRCLAEAGIDRSRTYITNVVKHFKWVPRGPRRIHSKPGVVEIEACFPWLEAEIAAVAPRIIVALGATAAQALFGRTFRVTRDRGRLVPSALAPYAFATVHPSALLRAPDEAARERETPQICRGFAQGSGDGHMSKKGFKRSTLTWIAVTLAVAAVLAVAIVIAEFWSSIGDSGISVAGWFAMGLGIVVTLALGIGLMSLMFFSNRRGYDENVRRDL